MNPEFLQGFKDAVEGVREEDLCNFGLDYLAGFVRGTINKDNSDLVEQRDPEDLKRRAEELKLLITSDDDPMRGSLDSLEDQLLYLELTSDRCIMTVPSPIQ